MPVVLGFTLFKIHSSTIPSSKFMDEQQIQLPSLALKTQGFLDSGHLPFNFYEWLSAFIFISYLVLKMLYAVWTNFIYIVHIIFMVLSVARPLMRTCYLILTIWTNFYLHRPYWNKFFMLNTFTILYISQVWLVNEWYLFF